MDILFCIPERMTKKLGAPKVYIELAEALEEQGCTCELVGLEKVAPEISEYDDRESRAQYYSHQLRRYITDRSNEFDVVEFEHKYLPFERSHLPSNILLVARSVLLGHHARNIRLPVWHGLFNILQNASLHFWRRRGNGADVRLLDYLTLVKKHVGTAVRYELDRAQRRKQAERTTKTCRAADLVIASNAHDRQTLQEEGVDLRKAKIIPFGLTEERYKSLSPPIRESSTPPTFVFVGTYDFRKGGATDIPRITRYLLSKYPSSRIRLLGTKGLFTNEKEVLAHFSPFIQNRVEVVPGYAPEDLPELLRGGTIGLFPSYYEGFPFGVLEMLAAGLPVFAYDAPGAPEMVPDDLIVELGDWRQLANKAERLVESESSEKWRCAATRWAGEFQWSTVAEQTIQAYRQRIEEAKDRT